MSSTYQGVSLRWGGVGRGGWGRGVGEGGVSSTYRGVSLCWGGAWWVGEGRGLGGRVLPVLRRVSVLGWSGVGGGGAWVRGACPPRTEACLCVGVGWGVVGGGGAWVRGACPPRTEACLCVGVEWGGWGRGMGEGGVSSTYRGVSLCWGGVGRGVLGWGVVGGGGAWVRGACPPRTEACLCVGVEHGAVGQLAGVVAQHRVALCGVVDLVALLNDALLEPRPLLDT